MGECFSKIIFPSCKNILTVQKMDATKNTPTPISTIKNSTDVVQSKRAAFLSTYNHHQPWSLPDSVIYYISKNQSTPKVYEKMIQSCKHFFIKNPILIVSIFYVEHKNNEWKYLLNKTSIDLKTLSCKIWITDELFIRNFKSTGNLSDIFPKIFKFPSKFQLLHQNISFNNLMFIASKCEYVRLTGVTVMNENGSIVLLEKLFQSLLNVKEFIFEFHDNNLTAITSKTVQELLKIPNFLNLNKLVLSQLPENFDIELFYDNIKKNKKTNIFLSFCNQISETYKARLQTIINELINDEIREYKPAFITFQGNHQISEEKLWKLYARECKYFPK